MRKEKRSLKLKRMVAGTVTDYKSVKVDGKIGIGSATTFTDGDFGGGVYTLEGFQIPQNETLVLGGDVEVTKPLSVYGILKTEGDMVVGNNLTLYGELKISKSLLINGGGIRMEEGTLTVVNDFCAAYKTVQVFGIEMTHEGDFVEVGGNFTYLPSDGSTMTGGTIEIGGDLDIRSNFYPTGTHKIILKGTTKQTISLAEELTFNILELKNYSDEGVYSETAIRKVQLIRNGCNITYGELEGSYGYTLTQDEVVEGDFILIDDVLDLSGHTLIIKGDLIRKRRIIGYTQQKNSGLPGSTAQL